MSKTQLDKISKPQTVEVLRLFTKSGVKIAESADNETIDVCEFAAQPAEVGVSLGITINLGDFNSARIDVTCKVPTYTEEAEAAYLFAYNFVESRLKQEAESVRNGGKKPRDTDFSPL